MLTLKDKIYFAASFWLFYYFLLWIKKYIFNIPLIKTYYLEQIIENSCGAILVYTFFEIFFYDIFR